LAELMFSSDIDSSVTVPLVFLCGTVIGDLRAGVDGTEFLETVLGAVEVNLDDLVRLSLVERSNEVATGDWILEEGFEDGNCETPLRYSLVASAVAGFAGGAPSAAI
jgi:hypothetical protein